MNTKQDILLWACKYLPNEMVFNMQFQDGYLISKLIHQFEPSMEVLQQCESYVGAIINLNQISYFFRSNMIPIDFNVDKVASNSQYDIKQLLYDIRRYYEQKKQQQNLQEKNLQNQVKQQINCNHGYPSPIAIIRQGQRVQYPQHCSEVLKNLVNHILVPEEQRPSIDQILNHPWIHNQY